MEQRQPRPDGKEKRKKAQQRNITSLWAEIRQSETKLASHPERVVAPANFYLRETKIGGIVAGPYYNPSRGTKDNTKALGFCVTVKDAPYHFNPQWNREPGPTGRGELLPRALLNLPFA